MPQYGDTTGYRPPVQRQAQPRTAQPRPGAPAGGAGAGPVQPDQGLSYSDDPILQSIRSMTEASNAQAEAGAAAARTQALIRFGYSPELAGLYDAKTAEAARQNSFSTLANLAQQHQARSRGIDESANSNNLFYSSTRGEQLGAEGRQYLGEQAGAQGSLQTLLGNIGSSLAGTRIANQEKLIGGEQDAYGRALDFALKYNTGTGGLAGSPLVAAAATPTGHAAQRSALLRRTAPRVAQPRTPRRIGQVA